MSPVSKRAWDTKAKKTCMEKEKRRKKGNLGGRGNSMAENQQRKGIKESSMQQRGTRSVQSSPEQMLRKKKGAEGRDTKWSGLDR